MISVDAKKVDAKKKENAGNFKNGGAEWAPAGQPERVSVHDFPGEEPGKVTPYGSCGLTADTGWVNVGTDHGTGAFAVASIRSWWNGPRRAACPGARRLLVTAGSGGSNGSRPRLRKTGLATFAAELVMGRWSPGMTGGFWLISASRQARARVTLCWPGWPGVTVMALGV